MNARPLGIIIVMVVVLGHPLTPATAADIAAAKTDPPTFAKDVAPILFSNCTSCHRPGEIGPFPLTSYAEAKKKAGMITKQTGNRAMPPWKAEEGYGDFLDARRLSDAQIATLKSWVDAGALEGDPAQCPPLPQFSEGWQLGTPDMVLSLPEDYQVPAEGRDIYRCFVLPVDIPEDRYVKALEFHPGNRRVVHHAIFYLDGSGAARKLDAADPGLGYTHFGGPGFPPSGALGGWAPGARPRFLPDGVAKPLRRGTDLVVQEHFHPDGKPETERSTIGLYFSKEKPAKFMLGIPMGTRAIDIPAGKKDYQLTDSFILPVAVSVQGITPHAHTLAKEIKATAFLPDGTERPLIWIKDWDFNWQEQYRYAEPFVLPAQTKVTISFTYDNSADNPHNPNTPPRRVTFGEGTTDEMCLLGLQVIPNRLLDLVTLLKAVKERAGARGLFGAGDLK